MKAAGNQKLQLKAAKSKVGCLSLSIITFVVLLLAFCVLLFFRYNTWFGNIEEAPYTTPPFIDRITLTPGENFMSERTVSWRFDTIPHESRVEYFRVDTLNTDTLLLNSAVIHEKIKSRAGDAYYYHARLPKLEEGAAYKYRIVSDKETTKWIDFKMPSSPDTLRFIYMGDVQDKQGFVSDSLFDLLRKKEVNYDFIAFGGDQIERPMDSYWTIWYESLREWAGQVPFVTVPGNHEYLKGITYRLDSRWIAQHNYPENGPEGFKGKSYYIDFPLMRMIILDSNTIHWPHAILKHYNWLEKTLKDARQPWVVVMFHHGVYTVRDGRMHPFMRYLFLPLLEKYKTDLVLQGHDHAYSRITTKISGDTITPVYVISNASPKFYRNGFNPIHDRLGSGISLYQKIQLTQDELTYKSLFFDGEVYDDLMIKRTREGEKKIIDNARNQAEVFNFDGFGDNPKGIKKKDAYLQAVKERKANRPEN
ncbi:purple acid phosphatase family protein [Massilibacteroides vaginae]|uniref:purple acid phosphatase family protein n=1 Tax=Massilibacteroides vaginae TaxID=1673718 RepID=UPI000A1CBB2E|nr:metallophosphoesterase family protein [Massilibacteroides vaginae]